MDYINRYERKTPPAAFQFGSMAMGIIIAVMVFQVVTDNLPSPSNAAAQSAISSIETFAATAFGIFAIVMIVMAARWIHQAA